MNHVAGLFCYNPLRSLFLKPLPLGNHNNINIPAAFSLELNIYSSFGGGKGIILFLSVAGYFKLCSTELAVLWELNRVPSSERLRTKGENSLESHHFYVSGVLSLDQGF